MGADLLSAAADARSSAAPAATEIEATRHVVAFVKGLPERLLSRDHGCHWEAQRLDAGNEATPQPPRRLLRKRRDDDLVEVAFADRVLHGHEGVRAPNQAVNGLVGCSAQELNCVVASPIGRLTVADVGDKERELGWLRLRTTSHFVKQARCRRGPVRYDQDLRTGTRFQSGLQPRIADRTQRLSHRRPCCGKSRCTRSARYPRPSAALRQTRYAIEAFSGSWLLRRGAADPDRRRTVASRPMHHSRREFRRLLRRTRHAACRRLFPHCEAPSMPRGSAAPRGERLVLRSSVARGRCRTRVRRR